MAEMPDPNDRHEQMAHELEQTGDYRVLRRHRPRARYREPDGSALRTGLMLDLETTGLDPTRHEIIEMALVPFTYSLDGRVFEVKPAFGAFNEPSEPIPPEITALTGIDDAMVKGHHLDPAEVTAFAAKASIVIAHNAAFDRRFAERFCPVFAQKPWGCSMSQVPWDAEGFDGAKLKYLAAGSGFFFDGHRATDDCLATLEVLARPLPKSGVPALGRLLTEARKATIRIIAQGAPFEAKDVLKGRGYRWADGADGRAKSWYRDVPEDAAAAELTALEELVYFRPVTLPTIRITAMERYSDRV